jgi:hypothetical protein
MQWLLIVLFIIAINIQLPDFLINLVLGIALLAGLAYLIGQNRK